MTRRFLLIAFTALFMTISAMPQVAWAQAPELQQPPTSGPRRQMATIIFSGLAGAILGLSTLSFYGRPQDELNNIAIGFALGIIVGASYTTYQAATKPYDYLEVELDLDEKRRLHNSQGQLQVVSYSWDF